MEEEEGAASLTARAEGRTAQPSRPRAHAPCLARYRSDLFLDSASHRANVELVSNIRSGLLINNGNILSDSRLYFNVMACPIDGGVPTASVRYVCASLRFVYKE